MVSRCCSAYTASDLCQSLLDARPRHPSTFICARPVQCILITGHLPAQYQLRSLVQATALPRATSHWLQTQSRAPVQLPRPSHPRRPNAPSGQGKAKRSDLGASPFASRQGCGDPQGKSGTIGRLRAEWGLDCVLPMRLVHGLRWCYPAGDSSLSRDDLREGLQEAPEALKPSFLRLSPLALTPRRAFPLRSIVVLGARSPHFDHLSTSPTHPIHHLDHHASWPSIHLTVAIGQLAALVACYSVCLTARQHLVSLNCISLLIY